MTAQVSFPHSTAAASRQRPTGFLTQVALITWRNLLTIFRTPQAILPPLVISIFFLVIYESTLGGAAGFLPGLSGNSYLGFILPLSIVSSALSGSSIAAQNLVRDIESGYFDKLILTPVSRTALLLGPILAGAFILGLQATIVIIVALFMGLESATGLAGLVTIVGLAVLLGVGFAGFSVSAALGSGNAAVTQAASFLFFPLTFLTASFVPLELLSGWLKVAATLNPITYVLEAMRSLLLVGWDTSALMQGVAACLILGIAMYALAVYALRVRTRRK
jgi:ABC-2 type transport system permease protein